MKNILFLFYLMYYLTLETLEPVFILIKKHIITLSVLFFLFMLFLFTSITNYGDSEFILFLKIISFFYLVIRALITFPIDYENNYNGEHHYVKDENYYKELEMYQYNGLTKDEINRRKKLIRKNLKKKKFI